MKPLKLFTLLLGLWTGHSEAQNCSIQISNDKPHPGETVIFNPEFKPLKSKTKVSITLSLFDSALFTDREAGAFIYIPESVGYYEFKALVKYTSKGKITGYDTIYLSLNCVNQYASISLSRNPLVLYHNVPVDIELNAPDISETDLMLSTSRCSAVKTGPYRYRLSAQKTRMEDTCSLFIIASFYDSLKLLTSFKMPIKDVPNPIISILFHGLSSDSALVLNPVPERPYEYPYTNGIQTYTMHYTLNGKTSVIVVNGLLPTPETMREIRSLPSGTWIYFEEITYWIKYSESSVVWRTSNMAFKLP